jgi:SAM-dependent methyltransferase
MSGFIDDFDGNQYDSKTRLRFLEKKVSYLLDEVSQLRTIVRHLTAAQPDAIQQSGQTRDSFDYQWRALPEGHAMVSNAEWKANVPKQIAEFADLPMDWFRGKVVMDAGCGQGRWTYGFGKLGVERCTSVDISEAGLARTAEIGKEFGPGFQELRKDLRQDLGLPAEYDLVWCFGVLHHTGNTFAGFQNLARCVKPGGYLFVMIYGEPRPIYPDDYGYYHEMFTMRSRLRNVPFEEKVATIEKTYGKDMLHGYFDAISPVINDLYRWDELVQWYHDAGFTDIKRTHPGTNHHMIGRRKA